MTMRKTFLAALMLWMALAATSGASAEDLQRLAQLKISIWPEYDTATVLVMLDGTLADATNLPREISVLIPAGARLHVATWTNADGSFAPEQPSQSTNLGDGYARVTYTVRTPQFHLEYYDDLLRGSPDKTMDFVFKAHAPIAQATLEIQQPLKATNFSVNPATQTTRSDPSGFKYFVAQYSNIAAAQAITTQVKYTKPDPNPSVPPTPELEPAAAPTPSPAPGAWSNAFMLVTVVVLGLLIVLGFFVLQQRSRDISSAAQMAPRSSRRSARRAESTASATAFCTQCGRALGPEDNFCARCGTQRRVT